MQHTTAPDLLGSPGEQRRREKVILQKLNERLEAVLANIRRDNIKKKRQIKDYERETAAAQEISYITQEDQLTQDKEAREIIAEKSQQISKSALMISTDKDIQADLSDIGSFEEWNGGDTDLASAFIEICTEIAKKEIALLRETADIKYEDFLNSTLRAAIESLKAHTRKAEAADKELTTEVQKLRQQTNDVQKANDDHTAKGNLYENPELEDAMNERIQVAMDLKEKELQSELQRRIDAKALELSEARYGDPSSAFMTPRKMDLVGDTVRVENECAQLEDQRDVLTVQVNATNAKLQHTAELQKQAREKLEHRKNTISAEQKRSVDMLDTINSLNDVGPDKVSNELAKQISEQDANNAVRVAKYNKAKQLLTSALDDAESKFKSVINLDSVLKEYEEILEDYEEQFIKQEPFSFEPPSHVPKSSLPSAPKFSVPQLEYLLKITAVKRGGARASKGPGKPAPKIAAKRLGKLDFSEEQVGDNENVNMPDVHSGSSEDDETITIHSRHTTKTSTFTSTSGTSTVSPALDKKRPHAVIELHDSDEGTVPALEVTSFSAEQRTVVIKNATKAPIKLNGYNVSQMLPDIKLPVNVSITIKPRPKNSPAKIPPYVMYWQEGKGVRILDPKGETVCESK